MSWDTLIFKPERQSIYSIQVEHLPQDLVRPSIIPQNLASCLSFNSEPRYSPTSLYRVLVFLYQVRCSLKIVTPSLRISDILWLPYCGDLFECIRAQGTILRFSLCPVSPASYLQTLLLSMPVRMSSYQILLECQDPALVCALVPSLDL